MQICKCLRKNRSSAILRAAEAVHSSRAGLAQRATAHNLRRRTMLRISSTRSSRKRPKARQRRASSALTTPTLTKPPSKSLLRQPAARLNHRLCAGRRDPRPQSANWRRMSMSRAPRGLMLLPKSRFSKRRVCCMCCAARKAGVCYASWAWREAACSMRVVRLRLNRCVVMAFSGAVKVRSWMMATFKRRSRPCRKRCGLLLCVRAFAVAACQVVAGVVPHGHSRFSGFPPPPCQRMHAHARGRLAACQTCTRLLTRVCADGGCRLRPWVPSARRTRAPPTPTTVCLYWGLCQVTSEHADATCSSHSGVSSE